MRCWSKRVPEATGAFLAQDPAPPPGKGPEFGEASPLGLLVVILLGVALVFLDPVDDEAPQAGARQLRSPRGESEPDEKA